MNDPATIQQIIKDSDDFREDVRVAHTDEPSEKGTVLFANVVNGRKGDEVMVAVAWDEDENRPAQTLIVPARWLQLAEPCIKCGKGKTRRTGWKNREGAPEVACDDCGHSWVVYFDDEGYPDECEGHPAGPNDPMGETTYCDGSCRS